MPEQQFVATTSPTANDQTLQIGPEQHALMEELARLTEAIDQPGLPDDQVYQLVGRALRLLEGLHHGN